MVTYRAPKQLTETLHGYGMVDGIEGKAGKSLLLRMKVYRAYTTLRPNL